MSLYCRVTLAPARLEELLNAPVKKVQEFSDWKEWWLASKTYGATHSANDMPGNLDALNFEDCPTVGDGIEAWTNADEFFAEAEYDSGAGVWLFSILEFTDSLREMTGMIALLRTAVSFSESADDFIVIARYLETGANDTGAYLVFEKPQGRFVDEPSDQHDHEARVYFERRLKET